ncbi:hypothetical protein Chor_009546 [Crotalus horridus]
MGKYNLMEVEMLCPLSSIHVYCASPVSQAAFCPREWLRYQRNCYGLFHEKLSWHEAEIRCQRYGWGTHLASILAWPETLIVSKHISAYMKEKGVDVWMGLHDVRHVTRAGLMLFA